MGGGGPSSTTSTTTTKTEPPAYVQPSAMRLLARSEDLSNRPYQDYPGQQVAPLTQQHNLGMGIVQQRALGGFTPLKAANEQAYNTLTGGYMGPAVRNTMSGVNNPYLQDVIDRTNQDVTRQFTNSTMPQTDASFARSGAFGGSAWQSANAENNRQMAAELAKNTSGLRMGDYGVQQQLAENYAQRQQQAFEQERQRQVGALGTTQQLSNQPYTDAMQMLGIGDIMRDYNQTLNNTGYQNFLNRQNWPLQNLDIIQNAIRTSMGGGGTSVVSGQMPKVNPTAGMIGGGLAGAILGNQIGSNVGSGYGGTGAALGAGAGALAGLLG